MSACSNLSIRAIYGTNEGGTVRMIREIGILLCVLRAKDTGTTNLAG